LKLIFAAVTAVVLLTSCAPAVKKIVFAVDPHWAPMEFLDDAKELQGYDIDLTKAVAQEAGFTVEFRQVPWDQLFPGLQAGLYDVVASAVVINPARQEKYDFSDPYLNAGQILVVPRGTATTRLDDLKGRPVGALMGSLAVDIIGKPGKLSPVLKTYNALDQAFVDLAAGHLAGVVAETPVAAQYSLRNPRFKDSFRIVGAPLNRENFGFVVAKGHRDLLATLNAALAKVQASGLSDDLASRWLR